MRTVAAVVLLVAGVLRAAAADDPGQYDCPAVSFAPAAGPSVVVSVTLLRSLRYELARADRVCKRRRSGSEDVLRSFPIRGTARARTPARDRALLGGDSTFSDIDTSTATSMLLPVTPGLPAYACYRFLSDTPAARLCLPTDIDGAGIPAGKGLLCNRGRCRPRKVRFISATPDLYEGAWDTAVALPGVATPVDAVSVTKRTRLGRLAMSTSLGARDVLDLHVELRGHNHLRFAGDRVTAGEPPVDLRGAGTSTSFGNLTIDADLNGSQGSIALTMNRTDTDPSPSRFVGCWQLAMADGTSVDLPLVVSPNGLGASRAAEELAGATTAATWSDGDCAATRSGRLVCTIPTNDDTVSLFGALTLDPPAGGHGELAEAVSGRSTTWTAIPCPAGE
jgi:hypothetical protein